MSTTPLEDQVAVVTGATSGIGWAAALSLAAAGARVCVVGRRAELLARLVDEAAASGGVARPVHVDLSDGAAAGAVGEFVEREFGRCDLLLHCAGSITRGTVAEVPAQDFDAMYALNVRAPYALTQRLLPLLTAARGQVVFVNSSAGTAAAGATASQYAATKHALRALADGLRAEVNRAGIRVTSVYPGRTATPMQAELHRWEGAAYEPDRLLQPADVADAILCALAMPRTAEVTDVHIRPFLPRGLPSSTSRS